jgi:hypothetical protein
MMENLPMWSVVDDNDRARWDYVPMERVGPLRFGMSPDDARAVMETHGFTGSLRSLQPTYGCPYLASRVPCRRSTAILDGRHALLPRP